MRLGALQLLGIALRQGLLNPNEVVPHLFALQGELGSGEIRELALKLLTTEGEKRPDVLRRRMAAGVKQAFEFQRQVYPTEKLPSGVLSVVKGSGATTHTSIFQQIFQQWIGKQRKLRESIYKSLVRLFDFETLNDYAEPNVPLLAFVAQVLAHLPYSSALDPLYIIHQATQIVVLQGVPLQEQMATVLRCVELSDPDAMAASNTGPDPLEVAARKKFPSKTPDAEKLQSDDNVLKQFMALCQRGRVISLLLRMKSFLMKVYNLSTARCLEYDPTVKERPSDRNTPKAGCNELFNTKDASFDTGTGIDNLIRNYAQFRSLMRDDQVQAESVEVAIEQTADEAIPTGSD